MQGPPPHFAPQSLNASGGDIEFSLVNVSHGTHTLAIGPPSAMEGAVRYISSYLANSDPVLAGGSAIFRVHGLKAGTYAIWCTIDGHADEGMVGTLVVK